MKQSEKRHRRGCLVWALVERFVSEVRIAVVDNLLEGTKLMASVQDVLDKLAEAQTEAAALDAKVDQLLAGQGGGVATQEQVDQVFDAVSALEVQVASTLSKASA